LAEFFTRQHRPASPPPESVPAPPIEEIDVLSGFIIAEFADLLKHS
jgi:hypothetical protein